MYLVPQFSPNGVEFTFSADYSGALNRDVFYFLPDITITGDLVITVWTPQWTYEGRDANNQPTTIVKLYTPGEVPPEVAISDDPSIVAGGNQTAPDFQKGNSSLPDAPGT